MVKTEIQRDRVLGDEAEERVCIIQSVISMRYVQIEAEEITKHREDHTIQETYSFSLQCARGSRVDACGQRQRKEETDRQTLRS